MLKVSVVEMETKSSTGNKVLLIISVLSSQINRTAANPLPTPKHHGFI